MSDYLEACAGGSDAVSVDAALERLRGETSVEDRLDIFQRVVEYWHGPIRAEEGIPEFELAGLKIPRPLRSWYSWAGRRREILSGQNELLDPGELREED